MSNIFYVGVCENRHDPMKLGRCKVRVFGLHTIDKMELPTADLPWSYPVQPINSAGISGIGTSPVGPIEGSWILVIFRDPDLQQPLMLGCFGGIPQENGSTTQSTVNEYVYTSGESLLGTTEAVSGEFLYGADGQQISKETTKAYTPPDPITDANGIIGPLASYIAKFESGSSGYNAYNRGSNGAQASYSKGAAKLDLENMTLAQIQHYQSLPKGDPEKLFAVGKYQCIPDTLTEAIATLNLDRNTVFSSRVQDIICQEYLTYRKRKQLKEYLDGNQSNNADLLKKAGTALAAEFASFEDPNYPGYCYGGATGSYVKAGNKANAKWSDTRQVLIAEWDFRHSDKASPTNKGGDIKVADPEVPTKELQAQTIIEEEEEKVINPTPIGDKDSNGNISTGMKTNNNTIFGFGDPASKYPAYVKEPDTNRLATGDNINKTIVVKKESQREINIRKANGGMFEQPAIPYNAAYPYNDVKQTEAGHVFEFDNTPGHERIHIYHKSGTFTEIDENGSYVNRVVGDGYEIIDRNGNVYIKGELNLTVDGAYNVKVNNIMNLEVSGAININIYKDANINVTGSCNIATAGDFNLRANNVNIESDNEINLLAGSDIISESGSSVNVKAKNNINMQSVESDINLNAKNNANLTAKGATNIDSKGDIKVNGASIELTNGTGNLTKAADSPDAGVSNLELPVHTEEVSVRSGFEPLKSTSRGAEVGFDEPDSGDYGTYVSEMIASNRISPADILDSKIQIETFKPESDTFSTFYSDVNEKEAAILNMNINSFNAGIQLSRYFTLGDLTKGGTRIPTENITVKGEVYSPNLIIANLKYLCNNVLDKIVDKYGKDSFKITSGFRRPGDLGPGLVEGGDHNRGCAVDIQFNEGKSKTYNAAKDLVTYLPSWNQIILEYNGSSVWLHIAFKPIGNKGEYFTMNHHKIYGGTYPKNGFILI